MLDSMHCPIAHCQSSTRVFDTNQAEAFQRLKLEEGWAAVVLEGKRGNTKLSLDQKWGSGKLRGRLKLMFDGYKERGYKGGGAEADLFDFSGEPENLNEVLLLLARLECERQEGGADATYESKSAKRATNLD
jgi:hypothetical protein